MMPLHLNQKLVYDDDDQQMTLAGVGVMNWVQINIPALLIKKCNVYLEKNILELW